MSLALPRRLARLRHLLFDAGFGHAMLLGGLVLTVAWLGLVAWGVAVLVTAAL